MAHLKRVKGLAILLKRIVSKNHRITAAKVTAELNTHLEDPVFTPDESFTNPTFTVLLQLLNL